MTPDLPFAPPYKLKIDETRWVEVLADGTQVDCTAPIWPAAGAGAVSQARPAASARGKAGPATQPAAVLQVPFAEKDEAKRLGARWDAANKKWYVPAGTDVAPFARWVRE
jgi:hypothetical protein